MKLIAKILFVFALLAAPLVLADEPKPETKPSILKQFGVHYETASAEIFDKAVDAAALEKGVGFFLKDAVDKCRAEATKQGKSVNSIGSMGGQWLELAVIVALKSKGLTPIYYQYELVGVADAVFDVAVFSEARGPIVLSCKTSLRERYKQAEQEAVATQKAFPKSYSCVVTLDADKKHVAKVRQKIVDKEVQALEAIYDETNFDKLFELLAKEKLVTPTSESLKKVRLVVK